MEKVYWNEKEQQIVTKDGRCLYDKAHCRENKECAVSRHTCIVELRRQLQCAAKGHKTVFEKVCTESGLRVRIFDKFEEPYIFKCSNCSLEIAKTEKELSATEREALKKLKLL